MVVMAAPPCTGTRRVPARRKRPARAGGEDAGESWIGAGSELGHLVVGGSDPLLARAEVDEHGDLVLDADHDAESVLVVVHSVVNGESFDRRRRGRRLERTGGQVSPG